MFSLLAETNFAPWAMLLGLTLLTVILLRRIYRRQGRRGRSTARARSRRPSPATQPRDGMPLADAPPEILRWHVEMHEIARDLQAELDSKMVALQTLIHVARQESERLEAAIAGVSQQTRQSDRRPVEAAESRGAAQLPGTLEQRRDAYRLADLGHSAEAIADFLGSPVGDVDMILGCRSGDE